MTEHQRPDNQDPDGQQKRPELRYPHEDIDSLNKLKTGREWLEAFKILGKQMPIAWRVKRELPLAERQSAVYRFINGDAGAEVVPQKYRFGDLVHELGYCAPRSVYISAGERPERVRDDVERELVDETAYFAKPVHGVRGEGTGYFHTIDELVDAVSDNSEDYLVQSDETPQEDWRYILHRDVHDTGKMWRVAYKKVRPIVTGDGTSTIAELINQSGDIPDDRKAKIVGKIKDRAGYIPEKDQVTPVAESGNISNGAYGQLPDADQSERMDRFMARFVDDLQAKIGSELNTMCFDLGIKDVSVYDGEYDFEKMKETVVFYEFQMPFGYTGYLDELYRTDGPIIEKLKNHAKRGRMIARLSQSVMKNLISPRQ